MDGRLAIALWNRLLSGTVMAPGISAATTIDVVIVIYRVLLAQSTGMNNGQEVINISKR
jgi:hypothetical protein